MKKFIYGTLMFFAIQTGIAQTKDAQTLVTNMGVKAQIEGIKQQILPIITTENVENFNKDFDAMVTDFVSRFSKLVDEGYKASDIQEANKKFAESKEIAQIVPIDAPSLEQKIMALQAEANVTMEGLVMKYGDPEALQAEE
ncbi:hypothetical protein [Paenimyroides viscosum]|jgi:hypothetical protein|uniref:Uncharacterized protein n=1 Tax=Paenimyroides viscosum TaxID=2488729 RepID=A0A3P1B203_9FLAO|nr:hypothetical protein [Paenimyroides viscosum]RRA94682.1 hypothetical protein EG242_08370 [Paenimyroides viscosum]